MNVSFTKASNGELTCSFNNFHLHSAYNPSKEAVNFVSSLKFSFLPKYILITEPCLSYTANNFRQLFPNAIICAIRYCDDFIQFDKLWDKVFYLSHNNLSLAEQLYSFFGDEGLVSCFFCSWRPSESIFKNEYIECWKQIKNAVLKGRSVLTTRSYFAKRWLKNSIKFCLFSKKFYIPQLINSPLILCASGPSLQESLPFIKKYSSHMPIICVSSALSSLIEFGIKPDMIISTDGGYWAKRHLSFSLQGNPIPIALSCESAIFTKFLCSNPIIPLIYGDGPGDNLLKECSILGVNAERNGTVSGTAVELLLTLTSSDIYICGLDLCESKNFVHCQPNELELDLSCLDNRLFTKETRITPSSFKTRSLEIYRDWFNSKNFNNRVHRVSKRSYDKKLKTINDLKWDDFNITNIDNLNSKLKYVHKKSIYSYNDLKENIIYYISKNIYSNEWITATVPAKSIIYERSFKTLEKDKIFLEIKKSMDSFYKDILLHFNREENVIQ